ncbi:acyltransferase family protein, partial [Phytoactinopolyspora endophytica]|uniref:acyltransferase family protein n=1 Tax=Phytoactinopolyspora endophytica TaxID=1642495 RepID=UPI0013EE20E7
MGSRRTRELLTTVDEWAEATPESRNRAVDFLRVAAIAVVVLFHWVLSITQREDGNLTNPNPVEDIAGGWLLTWVFQIMPLFFVIGGFANLTSWEAVRRRSAQAARKAGDAAVAPQTADDGRGRSFGYGFSADARTFLGKRLSRLLLPSLLFAIVWAIVDIVARLSITDYDGALTEMPIVFTPLWFLGAYVGVTFLVPVTATVHRRFGVLATIALGVVVAGVDLGRFGLDVGWLGAVNTALVWVFVHQLGYLWRDGALDSVFRRWACVVVGVAAVALATGLDDYPRSMVSIPSERISHMLPTTAVIAALAVAQVGVATLIAPAIGRWLHRRMP